MNTEAQQRKDAEINKFLSSFFNRVSDFNSKIENISGKKLEVIAVVIYAVAHMVVSFFHEPWYDEAVAWQIARSASLREILFQIPHYEGHPPLWHLILLPFAKLDVPYELSLSLVSLVFAGLAVGLIIFKSPFPRAIRLLIPFTYFFFYQYSVISRPYCVMMLAFILLAIAYNKRNENPLKYTVCLILLCLTSAYGIVFAGGLAIVWLWEMWNRKKIAVFIKDSLTDKRIWCLAGLLAFAMVLIVGILPREDTFAMNLELYDKTNNNFATLIAYTLFVLPVDSCITTVFNDYATVLQHTNLDIASVLSGVFIGGILWLLGIYLGKRKGTLRELCVPYILFAIFAASVYISLHHIGIALLFIVFWLWISLQKESEGVVKFRLSEDSVGLFKFMSVCLCCVALAMSLYWNAASCYKDFVSVYAIGRNEAKFISDNGLDKYTVMSDWDVYRDEENNIVGSDINHARSTDNVAAYFDHNIFFNFNDGRDDRAYSTHKILSEEETQKKFSEWANIVPDVLYGTPELALVYVDSDVELPRYVLVYSQRYGQVWKGFESYGYSEIYVRSELAEELGLEEIEKKF